MEIITIDGKEYEVYGDYPGGNFVKLLRSPSSPVGFVHLHVGITGGDGMIPPGLANDGIEKIAVTAAFRAGLDPNSEIIPIDYIYRINLRNDQGAIADVIKVKFISGICGFNFTTLGNPGIYHIDQADFTDKIGDMGIKLVGDSEFKIFRNFV